MQVKDFISHIEKMAPLGLQESYDNSGMQTGDVDMKVSGVLITLDVVPETIDEAIKKNCNLIIAHHPLTLSGIKSITGKTMAERILLKAIKNDIAIYAAHTNIDKVKNGVSSILAKKIGLENLSILVPQKNSLLKLTVFVPHSHAKELRLALFNSGAGHIGNYDYCSFNISGEGTFRANEESKPFAGRKGEFHLEEEVRIETILPFYLQNEVTEALIKAHPYEEPAYDFYPLSNEWEQAGLGMVGDLKKPMEKLAFFEHIKKVSDSACIRYTNSVHDNIKRVAVCGGSGSSFLKDAIKAGAQAFVSADFKYHQFFEGEGHIIIVDIGHYESEQFTKELFLELLTKNFPNFAFHLSEINTNPIKYYNHNDNN